MKTILAALAVATAMALILTVGTFIAISRVIEYAIKGESIFAYLFEIALELDVSATAIIYHVRGWTLSAVTHYYGAKFSESRMFEFVIDVLALPFDGWRHCRRAYADECELHGETPYKHTFENYRRTK